MNHIRTLDLSTIALGDRSNHVMVGPALGDQAAQIATSIVPANEAGHGLHTHDFDHFYYVVEGELEVEIDGERGTARAGDVVVFPLGSKHRHWNATDHPEIHIAVMVPPPTPGVPAAKPV